MMDTGIRLDVGCGKNCPPGWTGLDMRPLDGVEIVWDAEDVPWPLDDESVVEARAIHLVEHINPAKYGFLKFMDEVWRVLADGGEFTISCPHGNSEAYIQDPTHVNPISEMTWAYFDPLASKEDGGLYQIYSPKPWLIKHLECSAGGVIDVILTKRPISDSYEGQESPVVQVVTAQGNDGLSLAQASNTDHGLTSIVILTYNGLEHTQACLASIERHTPGAHEIIIIDNNSTDDTVAFLREYQALHDNVIVVENEENMGFGHGCNQGMALARGDTVVLLNNDTIVFDGWLSGMLDVLAAHPDCGLVGPMSNYVCGYQKILPSPRWATMDDLADFSARQARAFAGQTSAVSVLIGFCLAIKRAVIDKIGGLDTQWFPGNYEDFDYCYRAIGAGFECRIARQVFIHHVGSVAFDSDDAISAVAAGETNKDSFCSKWGLSDASLAEIFAFEPPPFDPAHCVALPGVDAPAVGRRIEGDKLTSIVILTYNGLEHTKRCLASIKKCTPEEHELIIVDNASTDGTIEFLRGYTEQNASVIANKRNRGFAGGMNQGIGMAHGGVVVLLNNDIVVTEGWLARLHEPFRQFSKCGLVGPMSNFVSGEQLVKDVPYATGDTEGLHRFAEQWARAHKGQTVPTMRLVGFCLAIHREVIDKIGGFDEQFFPGNYEDDDYCLRAIIAGFEARIARDAFIHHVGHVGFGSDGVDLGTALSDNRRRFRVKWGIPDDVESPRPVSFPPFDPGRHFHPLPIIGRRPERSELNFEAPEPVKEWPPISLMMIVRDEEANLADCLVSVGDLCNETIIVDTGSVDGTVAIAEAAGATVLHFEWIDDFAAARNYGLEHATGEWIFWMDADDRLDDANRERLKLAAASGMSDAFCCQIESLVNGSVTHTILGMHTRLFRNRPEVRFRFAIHEDATPAIVQAGMSLAYTNILIEHTGYASGMDMRVVKARRNRDILLRELADDPDNARFRYHLGVSLQVMGDFAGAIEHMRIVIDANAPVLNRDHELYQAHLLLITSLAALGHQQESSDMLERALFAYPDNRHLLTLAAAHYISDGRIDDALAAIDEAEGLPMGAMRWPDDTLDEYRRIISEISDLELCPA